MKKGTSEPNFVESDRIVSYSSFKFHNLLSPINVAAALLEPPAKPAPIGIFFFKNILAPKF